MLLYFVSFPLYTDGGVGLRGKVMRAHLLVSLQHLENYFQSNTEKHNECCKLKIIHKVLPAFSSLKLVVLLVFRSY